MVPPIRVAQIMGYMNGGGVESVVMNYYRHIDHSRIQFDYIVCDGSTTVPRNEIEALGGRVFMVPPYSRVVEYQRNLESLFREQGWTIVHSHMNALSVFSLRAAKRAGVPIRIAHSHSSNGGGKGEFARDLAKGLLKNFSRRYPTDMLACSRIAGDWLYGKDADYIVLPNAVDVASFAPNRALREEMRKSLGINEDTFVLGHIGRVVPPKNHEGLISIFKEVLAIESESLLLIVGDGPLLKETETKVGQLGIADKVRFLGQTSDVRSFYQAFDVFCLPSVYEGLPVVAVECQASGTPILVSNAVTEEAAITSILEFEALSSTPAKWAGHLLAMRGKTFHADDLKNLSKFDVRFTAEQLSEYYEDRLRKVNCS